jgi:hypothetical protein
MRSGLSANVLNRRNDIGVCTATADIAVHGLLYVVIGWADGFLEYGNGRHSLAGGAVATLVSVMLDEGCLHRMQMATLAYTFDRDNFVSGMHYGKRKTGIHAAAVDMDRTCAALAMVTAFLGARQIEVFTQTVQQGRAWIDAEPMDLPVNRQGDRHFEGIRIDLGRRLGPQIVR